MSDYQGLVTKWREYAAEDPDECKRCNGYAYGLTLAADELAEVIARNVQPSPELDDDDPVEAMERCIGIDPPRARPVQRSPGDAHSHVSEVLAEATRLGFSAHDNSWKQLGAIIEDALESYATKTRGVKR